MAGFKERGGGVGWTSLSSEACLLRESIPMSTVGMDDDNLLYAAERLKNKLFYYTTITS